MKAELKAIADAHDILSLAKYKIALLDCQNPELFDSLCTGLDKLQKRCDKILTIYGMGKPA